MKLLYLVKSNYEEEGCDYIVRVINMDTIQSFNIERESRYHNRLEMVFTSGEVFEIKICSDITLKKFTKVLKSVYDSDGSYNAIDLDKEPAFMDFKI